MDLHWLSSFVPFSVTPNRQAHPTLSEHERKRLCRVMDCQKLSVDACMHAAQNERLPLRVVIQVLFSEQIKINNAISNNTMKEAGESRCQPIASSRKTLLEGTPQSFQEGWTAAKKDINTLKFELDTMNIKYLELQNNMENLQRQFEKILKQKQTSSWSSGWKKLSKLTKMNALENQDLVDQVPITGEKARKTHRRWRNSISWKGNSIVGANTIFRILSFLLGEGWNDWKVGVFSGCCYTKMRSFHLKHEFVFSFRYFASFCLVFSLFQS